MKLKTFNADNVSLQVKKNGPAIMHMNYKTGVIHINPKACDMIGLQAGDQLQFHQDEEDAEQWFIEKVSKNGFAIRGKQTKGAVFNCSTIVRLIFDSLKCNKLSGRVLIGEQVKLTPKQTVYRLITASLNAYKGE